MFSVTWRWQSHCFKVGHAENQFAVLASSNLRLVVAGVQLKEVRPDRGKVGSVLRVRGSDLSKEKVDSVYLSDQTLDMMVKVLNQTDSFIEFRIPPSVKPGRLQLVIKTTGKEPHILEQPFYIKVEEPKQRIEIAASSK